MKAVLRVAVLVAALVGMTSVAWGEERPAKEPDSKRIVGGQNDTFVSNQWVTALLLDGHGQFCGGSLVRRDYVLTAQHCTEGTKADEWRVRVGSKKANKGGAVRDVIKIKEYPEYGNTPDGGVYGDIALMKLKKPVSYKPVKLVATGVHHIGTPAGNNAYINGWGAYFFGDNQDHNRLQYATIPLLGDSACDGLEGYDGAVMICAGAPNVADTCQGDSGGPLSVYLDNKWWLVGVTSWGYGCAGDTPGAYAWVGATALRIWLYEKLGGR